MGRARDLAEQALRIAAQLSNDDILAFSWHGRPGSNAYRVTIELTNGRRLKYIVIEESEEDSPSGESLPW